MADALFDLFQVLLRLLDAAPINIDAAPITSFQLKQYFNKFILKTQLFFIFYAKSFTRTKSFLLKLKTSQPINLIDKLN